MAEYLIQEESLKSIADAVRTKTQKTDELTINEIVSEILNIEDAILNFNVVGGTTQPTNPIENTIWVNTDMDITKWYFSNDEPNIYTVKCAATGLSPWWILSPHILSDGDIVNFTIPEAVTDTYERIMIVDAANNAYYLRTAAGNVLTAWSAGTKVAVRISSNSYPINGYGDDGGTAHIIKWANYYHDEGDVWIKTWPSSVSAFNVIKNNSILVYPVFVNQYINDTWTTKDAYMYLNNSWTKLSTERILFDATSPFAGMTGLWSSINGGSVSETQLDVIIHYSHEGSEVYTTEPIDLSLYNTLHVQVSNYHSKSYMGIITTMIDTTSLTSFDSNYAACAATKAIDKANTEFTLDLTSTTGSYHIWIGNTGGGSAQNFGCNVTKVWLTM